MAAFPTPASDVVRAEQLVLPAAVSAYLAVTAYCRGRRTVRWRLAIITTARHDRRLAGGMGGVAGTSCQQGGA
jgi:hypothetical protein